MIRCVEIRLYELEQHYTADGSVSRRETFTMICTRCQRKIDSRTPFPKGQGWCDACIAEESRRR